MNNVAKAIESSEKEIQILLNTGYIYVFKVIVLNSIYARAM